MKNLGWLWLLLAVVPGCVLVQPLDNAAPSSDGGDSSSSHAGSGNAGSSSSHAGSSSSGAGGSGGSGGSPSSSKLAPFLGTWTATSGTLTLTCPGIAPSNTDATGSETWSPGTASDLVAIGFESTCNFNANVSGKVATGLPRQVCNESSTATNGDAITQSLTFTSLTFVVSADGATATQKFSGTDLYTDTTTAQSLTCTFSETAEYAQAL
jgi:hypothetical protein